MTAINIFGQADAGRDGFKYKKEEREGKMGEVESDMGNLGFGGGGDGDGGGEQFEGDPAAGTDEVREETLKEAEARKMRESKRLKAKERLARQGGAVQVDPGFSPLTPRLFSTLETKP